MDATGLNRTTVGALVGELADRGLVFEAPASPDGLPGRPSMTVYPKAEGAIAIAIDLSVDSAAVASIGFDGSVIKEACIDLPRNQHSPEQVIDTVSELYHSQISPGLPHYALVGIGVSVPGIVSTNDGIARLVPSLGWQDVPLASLISAALEASKSVYLGNHGYVGAIAEFQRGAAVGVDNFVYLTGNVDVSGGLIIDGGPMKGAAGYGGEVGHLPINPNGRLCSCGSYGCWETEVGEYAILRRAGYPEDGGKAAVDDLLKAAELGDKKVLNALEETGHWLGTGITGLIHLLNPNRIILANLFSRIHPYIADAMADEINRRAMPVTRELVTIVTSTLGEQGSLLGAAALAFQPLLQDPLTFLSDEPAGIS